MTLKQGIAQTTLILSLGLYIFYLCPFINRSFPLALGMEFWPYVCVIPCFGLGFRLFHPDLRGQRLGLGLASLLLVLSFTPWFHWLGMPSIGTKPAGLRMMSYNIWTQNQDYDAIQLSIQREKPDILFLTEITLSAMRDLENRLEYPYSQRSNRGSNAFFSRYPILSTTPEYPNATDHGLTFSLVAQIQTPQEILTVVGIHPPIPLTRSSFAVRNQQFERLAPFIRQVPNRVIVLGDFNTSPWSPYFDQFLQEADLSSATRGQGIWATWSYESSLPHWFAKIPIDHVASRGFDCIDAWTGHANGSDHRPVIAKLKPI